uniref:Uncharacterized protein n=1 Tax=Chromera velia CCMP2878 TaxID=1169474 RepID=A0A0G4FQS0_9ALVE|eukprot:Cvel_18269.t1-p1 / transcript=Cvel_18269.t1 / gene=Cvel_18269 / organism=Chromera_velia_CCMP2878 / gene_product=Bifunctional protein FolD, putative / transcript_product=Bifunctional protein FolD, putative / location=Cvel_scaffold1505:4099-5758(+) / protein_length=515 / sequence_SO=supercontig / SO=protein_coding / is_pseudo=false
MAVGGLRPSLFLCRLNVCLLFALLSGQATVPPLSGHILLFVTPSSPEQGWHQRTPKSFTVVQAQEPTLSGSVSGFLSGVQEKRGVGGLGGLGQRTGAGQVERSKPFIRDGNVIDGKAVAAAVRAEVRADIEARLRNGKFYRNPSLAVVLVGNRTDSATYVRMKDRAASEVGIESNVYRMPESASQDDLMALVRRLNANLTVDGLLIQLPLPDHMDENVCLSAIAVEKDVDGLHPSNVGNLVLRNLPFPGMGMGGGGGVEGLEEALDRAGCMFKPCTPFGSVELLKRCGVQLEGKSAVVLGRSRHVGLPTALLLGQENATVSLLHSRSSEHATKMLIREADIIVAAMGRAGFVKGGMVKEGAVVVDVGINPVPDPSKKAGYRLVGDVEFEEVKAHAGLITPVPGGVGPMTVAMLMVNTLTSSKRRQSNPLLRAAEAEGWEWEDDPGRRLSRLSEIEKRRRRKMLRVREDGSMDLRREGIAAAIASALTAALTLNAGPAAAGLVDLWELIRLALPFI